MEPPVQAIALNGRDCSVQRRHQKIIEEGPPVVASPEVWRDMERSAVELAKKVLALSTHFVVKGRGAGLTLLAWQSAIRALSMHLPRIINVCKLKFSVLFLFQVTLVLVLSVVLKLSVTTPTDTTFHV